MNLAIRISPLDLHPSDALKVGEWIKSEWGTLQIHSYIEAIAHGDRPAGPLPRTLVAHHENQIIGTISLLSDDLETRPEINPWIGCLYVSPNWRRQGIGGSLLVAAERMASQELGISKIFLFTEAQEKLYSSHGWIAIERDRYHNKEITIMLKQLS